MKTRKLARTIEISVPTISHDDLIFRLEIFDEARSGVHNFYMRVYRLEQARLRVRADGPRGKHWENADYRCWVVDDNLLDDRIAHSSPGTAVAKFRRMLRLQIGPPLKRPNKRT